MKVFVLNGHEMTSIKHTHEYIAKEMHFPDYYGNNLDALADCLSELTADTYVIVYGVSDMKKHLGQYADKLVKVFTDLSASADSFNFILCDIETK